jgi:hypothetical protein
VPLRLLPVFMEARPSNWRWLRRQLEPLGQRIGFSLPTLATAWNPENGAFTWDESACRSDCVVGNRSRAGGGDAAEGAGGFELYISWFGIHAVLGQLSALIP